MSQAGGIENILAQPNHGGRQTVVNHGRCEQAEARMAVVFVVPGEEVLRLSVRLGLRHASEFRTVCTRW
jgi:hypothetical protein